MPDAIDLLKSRRSVKPIELNGPGPTAAELATLLTVASRVPDHGKLTPWRFIVFEGEGRERIGQILAECIAGERDGTPERVEQERARFLRAPVVVAVVSRARDLLPIPVWEQQLSAGAVCMTMLMAAHSMGFVASWVTEWCAYHPGVLERMGLKPNERVAGFVYIGHPGAPLEDRPRPSLDTIVTRF